MISIGSYLYNKPKTTPVEKQQYVNKYEMGTMLPKSELKEGQYLFLMGKYWYSWAMKRERPQLPLSITHQILQLGDNSFGVWTFGSQFPDRPFYQFYSFVRVNTLEEIPTVIKLAEDDFNKTDWLPLSLYDEVPYENNGFYFNLKHIEYGDFANR